MNTTDDNRKLLVSRQEILTKILATMAIVIAILEVSRLSDFSTLLGLDSSPVTYSIVCLISALVFMQSRFFRINTTLMLFCVACAISLIFNHPMVNYMSTLRFCLFFVMLVLLSPLVDSRSLRQFRGYLWRYTVLLCQLVVILSLVLYLVTLVANGRGRLFMAVCNPITLSTVSAIVGVILSYRLIKNYGKCSIWGMMFDLVSLFASILLMIWAGSRSAVIGFTVAEIYILATCFRYRKAARMVFIAIVASVALSSLMGGNVTFRVVKKFEIAQKHNSIIYSRKQLWLARIDEFRENPIVGVGFANVTRYSSLYDNEVVKFADPDKNIEPGSSWLNVLSTTGIVGFAILACFNIRLLRMVRRRRRAGDMDVVEYGALLLFFIAEGFFEGWMLYAGSFLFFIYWLLTSRISEGSRRFMCSRQISVAESAV